MNNYPRLPGALRGRARAIGGRVQASAQASGPYPDRLRVIWEGTMGELESGGRGRRALVVEQDHQRGRLVELMLRRRGFRPQRVTSGVDALLYLRDNEVELIVAEHQLSDMAGDTLLRAVRRDGRGCRTALLGGEPGEHTGDADAIFPHPFSPAALGRFAGEAPAPDEPEDDAG